MKKITFTFIFFLFISTTFAQPVKKTFTDKSDKIQTVFYAIDGSKWNSEKGRDAQEEKLWNNLFSDLDYIKSRKLLNAEHIPLFVKLLELYKEQFSDFRMDNKYIKSVIDKDYDLKEYKESFMATQAKNNEIFYTLSLKEIFDLCLEQYDLISKYLNDAINSEMGASDQDSQKLNEKGRIYAQAGLAWAKKMDKFRSDVRRYKEENMSPPKKTLFYAFDGKQYKTLKGRDNYELRVEEKYKEIFNTIKAEINNKKDIEYLEKLVFLNLNMLRNVREFNDQISFLGNETVRTKAIKEFPSKDFVIYNARNNEVCYTKEIYDWYEALLGCYEIYDAMMNNIDKSFKSYMEGEDSVKLSLNIKGQKDSRGVSIENLGSIIGDAPDSVGPFVIELVEFYYKL